MTAMKLQKLVYYSEVWSLVWTESSLFTDKIEAWANGPVVRALYNKHRGFFKVHKNFFQGDTSRLSSDQKDVINKVLEFYGKKDPQWLSNLTHLEEPWKNARQGMRPGDRCEREITREAIIEYYSSL